MKHHLDSDFKQIKSFAEELLTKTYRSTFEIHTMTYDGLSP